MAADIAQTPGGGTLSPTDDSPLGGLFEASRSEYSMPLTPKVSGNLLGVSTRSGTENNKNTLSSLKDGITTPTSDDSKAVIGRRRSQDLRSSLSNPEVRIFGGMANSHNTSMSTSASRLRKRASIQPAPLQMSRSTEPPPRSPLASQSWRKQSLLTFEEDNTTPVPQAVIPFPPGIAVESVESHTQGSGEETESTVQDLDDTAKHMLDLMDGTATADPVAFDTGMWSAHEEENFLKQWCERVPLPKTSLENLHGRGLGRHGARGVGLCDKAQDWLILLLLAASCAMYIFLIIYGESLRHECISPCGSCGTSGLTQSKEPSTARMTAILPDYLNYFWNIAVPNGAPLPGSSSSGVDDDVLEEFCDFDWTHAHAHALHMNITEDSATALSTSGISRTDANYNLLLQQRIDSDVRTTPNLKETLLQRRHKLWTEVDAWHYALTFGVIFVNERDFDIDTSERATTEAQCMQNITLDAKIEYPNGHILHYPGRHVNCDGAYGYCAVSLFGDGIGHANTGRWNLSVIATRCDGMESHVFVYQGRQSFYRAECIIRYVLLVGSVVLFVALLRRVRAKQHAKQPFVAMHRLLYGVFPALFFAINPFFLVILYYHGIAPEEDDSGEGSETSPLKQFFFVLEDLPPRLLIAVFGTFVMTVITHDTMDLKRVPTLLAVSIDKFIPFGVPKSVVSLSVKVRKEAVQMVAKGTVATVFDTLAAENFRRNKHPEMDTILPLSAIVAMLKRHVFLRSLLKADEFEDNVWVARVNTFPTEVGCFKESGVTKSCFVEGWLSMVEERCEMISASSGWLRPKSKAFSTFHFDLSEQLDDRVAMTCPFTVQIKLRYLGAEKERRIRITNEMLRCSLSREVILPLPIFSVSEVFCDLESVLVAAALVTVLESTRPEVQIRLSGWLPLTLPSNCKTVFQSLRNALALLLGLFIAGSSVAVTVVLTRNQYHTTEEGKAAVVTNNHRPYFGGENVAEVMESASLTLYVVAGVVVMVNTIAHIRRIPYRHARCIHLIFHLVVVTVIVWVLSTVLSNLFKPSRVIEEIRPWRDGDLMVLPLAGYIFAVALSLFPPPVFSIGMEELTKANLAQYLRETGGMRLRTFRSMTEKLYIDQWLSVGRKRDTLKGVHDGKVGSFAIRDRHDSRPSSMPTGAPIVRRLGSRRRVTLSRMDEINSADSNDTDTEESYAPRGEGLDPFTPAVCYNLPMNSTGKIPAMSRNDRKSLANEEGSQETRDDPIDGDWTLTRRSRQKQKQALRGEEDEDEDEDEVTEAAPSPVGGEGVSPAVTVAQSLPASTPHEPYGSDEDNEKNDTKSTVPDHCIDVTTFAEDTKQSDDEKAPSPKGDPQPRPAGDELSQAFCLETAVHCFHAASLVYEPVLRPTALQRQESFFGGQYDSDDVRVDGGDARWRKLDLSYPVTVYVDQRSWYSVTHCVTAMTGLEVSGDFAEHISEATTPFQALHLAREQGLCTGPDGNEASERHLRILSRIKKANLHKFQQNTDCRTALLATGTRHIYYVNDDPYWGCSAADLSGENVLGELLMDIRRCVNETVPLPPPLKRLRARFPEYLEKKRVAVDADHHDDMVLALMWLVDSAPCAREELIASHPKTLADLTDPDPLWGSGAAEVSGKGLFCLLVMKVRERYVSYTLGHDKGQLKVRRSFDWIFRSFRVDAVISSSDSTNCYKAPAEPGRESEPIDTDTCISSEPGETKCLILSTHADITPAYVIVAFRGTVTFQKGETDLRNVGTDCKCSLSDLDVGGQTVGTHAGFRELYDKVRTKVKGALLRRLELNDVRDDTTLCFTGHSLGGALATLAAIDFSMNTYSERAITMYNFGSPRVGNRAFADLYDQRVPDSFRVVCKGDPVTMVPPMAFYTHVGHSVLLNSSGEYTVDASFAERRLLPFFNPLQHFRMLDSHRRGSNQSGEPGYLSGMTGIAMKNSLRSLAELQHRMTIGAKYSPEWARLWASCSLNSPDACGQEFLMEALQFCGEPPEIPTRVPLKLFYSKMRHDHLVCATSEHQQWAAVNGYHFIGVLGAVFTFPRGDGRSWFTGELLPLYLYHNPVRNDHMTCAHPEARRFAKQNGYVEKSIEGFVFPVEHRPQKAHLSTYGMLHTWSPHGLDHSVQVAAEGEKGDALADAAERVTYVTDGVDCYVAGEATTGLAPQFWDMTGTVPLGLAVGLLTVAVGAPLVAPMAACLTCCGVIFVGFVMSRFAMIKNYPRPLDVASAVTYGAAWIQVSQQYYQKFETDVSLVGGPPMVHTGHTKVHCYERLWISSQIFFALKSLPL